ncbi:hypothetical protein QQZ08_000368 [Neonectria magnoliae]|uniref:chitinase n=1 Tax=Neonectria magnoliae TaxID=2732573 RepID=A0ABR1IGX6_9HYPO
MTRLTSSLASVVGLLSLGGVNGAYALPPSSLVASTYFAGFHASRGFPLSDMSWDKFTDVKYAFAETSPDGSLDLSRSEPDQLPIFVNAAKKNGVKALISIGGWTGSRWFSTSFGSSKNRTAFAKTCLDFVKEHDLDGIDFEQGLGCNTINEDDTVNFLSFLKELRKEPAGKDLFLTAAGSLFPWNNASGVASSELSGFASVLDYIMVMNYDLHGAWSPTGGPNAPLYMACDPRNTQGAGNEGINKWLAAGIPSSQVVLGVPAYGHGFSVNKTSAFDSNGKLNEYPPQNRSHRFQGSSWDSDPPVDDCGNAQLPGGTYTFWSLITEAGFLDDSGKPAPGISHAFDNCSKTPIVYNETSKIWVSYDDARSFAEKGKFVISKELGGFATYEAGGDHNNILIDSIRAAVGLS